MLVLAALGAGATASDQSSLSPPERASALVVTQVPAGYQLRLDGVATVRTTADQIRNARLVTVNDSPVLLVIWDERAPTGDTLPYYAISLDGQTFTRVRRTSYEIRLLYEDFDPLERTPAIAAELQAVAGSNLYIVQFLTQPLEAFLRPMRAMGATLNGFLANHAQIVTMTPDVRDQVEALPFVRWVGPFHPAYRLEAYLRDNLHRASEMFPSQRYFLRVAQRGARMKDVVAKRIQALGGTVEVNFPNGYLLQATLTPSQLLETVRWDEVLFVDRWSEPEADMNLAREIGGANYLEGLEGYAGQGVRAEVMDVGMHENHPDIAEKVIFHGPKFSGENHGTSTFGINFGSGEGNALARGLVPEGRGIYAEAGGFSDRFQHTAELLQHPFFGVYQSNSWGNIRTTQYTNISADFDDLLFHNDILICQSQSNAGNQNSRPQAWAKNVVSVGGVNHRNNLNPDDDFWAGASIGPAADGRIKPDLVHFYDDIWTITGTAGYSNFCCTSGATPIVAGHFGIFFQMWHDGAFGNPKSGSVFHSRPHMSTAKAMMINSAFQYPFSGQGHNLTRNHQGWGVPDLARMYDMGDRSFIVDETDLLTNLSSRSYTLAVPASEPQLRATMIYSDPAGKPFSSVNRINDLTLRVTSPTGTVYYGNNGLLEGNASTPDGDPNTIDTVENVFVDDPAPGEWTFEVLVDEINEDGHLETPALDADFALVVSGVEVTPAPRSYFDADGDGDVDGEDFAAFVACSTGPVGSELYEPIADGCEDADCDGDQDVDFADYACLARSFSGNCGMRITQDIQDQFGCFGGNVVFHVEVEGENLSYQWFRDAEMVTGATSPTLIIQPINNAAVGGYHVFVSSDCAMSESHTALLTASVPPTILSQPQDVTDCLGGTATFSVSAEGVGTLQYQWRFNDVDIPGETDTTYTIPVVEEHHVGLYRCAIWDDCEIPVLTDQAQLAVVITAFESQPTGGEVCLGGTIFLIASATGTPQYQWYKDGVAIPGATTFMLIIPDVTSEDSGAYHSVAIGACNSDTSEAAVIDVIQCGAP